MKLKIQQEGEYFLIYQRKWFRWVNVYIDNHPMSSRFYNTFKDAETDVMKILNQELEKRNPKMKPVYYSLYNDTIHKIQ